MTAKDIGQGRLSRDKRPDYSSWCGDCCPECGWHNLHTAWCSQAQRIIPTAKSDAS